MPAPYSQLRASFALAKASLIAMLRSPTSVVFSLLFPVIFIIVFGSMVDTTAVPLKIAQAPRCDTANIIYQAIRKIKNISIHATRDSIENTEALKKGRLAAIVDIKKDSTVALHYIIALTTSPSAASANTLLQTVLQNAIASANAALFPSNPSVASMKVKELPGRVYKQIDFILPGQLGFSLLMAGVFGSSFLLFGLRQSLVLKRLSVTPVHRTHLILGEMLSRLFFHILSFIIMIALGYFVFEFTLVNGIYTFLEMLLFSLLGLIVFMSIGFIISGVVKNESSIAPVANTCTLPQILLCGLFFPVENYPGWLQSFCNILPLTFFVDGLRRIAFEGMHSWQLPVQVAGLAAWAVVMGIICIKVFKWE